MKKFLLLLILIVLQSFQTSFNPNTPRTVLNDMFEAISAIRTVEYKLHMSERIKGNLDEINSEIKVNVKPRKIYLSNPEKKLEVLFCEGLNDGKAYVNPGKFPYLTLSLDPYGNLMHNNQHHSIDDLGFAYIGDLIKNASQINNRAYFDKSVKYDGIIQWKGINCYKIFMNFPDFKIVSYTPTVDENVRIIAKKFNCGEFRIIEKNSGVSYNEVVEKGKTIKVPSMYAKMTMLYIDTKSNLPVSIKVMDGEGLYESFELSEIKINKGFAKDEFTKDFPQYHFK